MKRSLRISSWGGLLVFLLAGALVLSLAWARAARIGRITLLAAQDAAARPDAASATGYADGWRRQIVPDDLGGSLEWIAQTQTMLARGEARIRHVDSDNAPDGRETRQTSPYRWWLGLVAKIGGLVGRQPPGRAVEWAAVWSDPLLQLGMMALGAAVAGRAFGWLAGAGLALAWAAYYPLAALFLAGLPDERGAATAGAAGSVLLLGAGIRAAWRGVSGPARWAAIAGLAGGCAVWIDAGAAALPLSGLLLAAPAAAVLLRPKSAAVPPGFSLGRQLRAWSDAGGITVLAACAAEYLPHHLSSARLDSLHPLYGVAWIGAGRLAAAGCDRVQGGPPPLGRAWVWLGLWTAAALPLPAALLAGHGAGFLARDPGWSRLARIPGAPSAANLWSWLGQGGGAAAWAALLPLGGLMAAGILVARRRGGLDRRVAVALALGPALISLACAIARLDEWASFEALALVALVMAVPSAPGPRLGWIALAAAPIIPGLLCLWPAAAAAPLASREAEPLIERHLAHWLSRRAGGAETVVYAPPAATAELCYYGGLRGIGTLAPENSAGLEATLMIAGAGTLEEARAHLQARAVRFLVIPSWDPFFDTFAARYLAAGFSHRRSALADALRREDLPPWLRAVPYQLPVAGGFATQSALVFEVVDEQSRPLALGRLAEALVEMGQSDRAEAVSRLLGRFPGDVGALTARLEVEISRGDEAAASAIGRSLLSRLSTGADRYLPWDRRVSLVVALALLDREDLARQQARRCLDDANPERLRFLTTGTLFNFLSLCRSLEVKFADPRQEALARSLLPADLGARLSLPTAG